MTVIDKLITKMTASTKSPVTKQTVTRHPAFPLVVAIWFGVLLGLGSLILPAALYVSVFEATGIASVFSPLAPPIDFTTRGVIAIIAALAGAAGGFAIARRIVSNSTDPAMLARLRPSDTGRKPISAHEELGEDGFDGDGSTGRKRPLAMQDAAPRSQFFDAVPLPGEAGPDSHMHDDRIGFGLGLADDVPAGDDTNRMMNDQHDMSMPPFANAPDVAPQADVVAELRDSPEFDGNTMPAETAWQEDVSMTARDSEESTPSSLNDMATRQLVDRLAASIARRRELAGRTASAAVATAIPPISLAGTSALVDDVEAAAAEEAAQAMAAYFGGSPKPASPAPAQPLSFPSDLPREFSDGPEQALGGSVADAGERPFDLTDFAEADEYDSALRQAEPPSYFRSFAAHDHDDDEDDAQAFVESFSLPFLKNAMNSAEPAPGGRAAEDSQGEGRLGSLLNSGNAFTARLQEFVRAKQPDTDDDDFGSPFGNDSENSRQSFRAPTSGDDDQAVPTHTGRLFDPPRSANPGNPREHSAESENALRGALETLRRLSGAA
ncbi:hypothetical protein GRI97_01350 [Altererythrobacter xixiisoli]|uniref:Uncharacterized protein n=1 Tax=Croceibacterium xixiisoli TaxID=1476466 RepID=A0A6I4TTF1_9SPHN|nr:hypothetical protein [Croceibacterium xixiisoli]MXO97633.1 hypothetical protein [Croceibacterium xixiisoli]